MPTHPGQLAFVGGHKSRGEDPIITAIREFSEETSYPGSSLNIIGALDFVKTSYSQVIVPFLCYLDMEPINFLDLIKSNGEWTNAILVPIEYFLNKDFWSQGIGIAGSRSIPIHFCPIMYGQYLSKSPNIFDHYLLWGATGRIIWNFFEKYGESVKKIKNFGDIK